MSYYKRPLSDFGEKLDGYNKRPGVTQIRFDEYFAKNILRAFADFPDIQVADRPDLRCTIDGKRIGIEVVSSSLEDYNKLWSFVDYRDGCLYIPEGLHDSARKIVDRFFPLASDAAGVRDINLSELDCRRCSDSVVKEIKAAFDRKLKKLNDYKKLSDNMLDECRLFIRCRYNVMFSVSELTDMAEYFQKCGGYTTVFVFDDVSLRIMSDGCFRTLFFMDDVQRVSDETVSEILGIIAAYECGK